MVCGCRIILLNEDVMMVMHVSVEEMVKENKGQMATLKQGVCVCVLCTCRCTYCEVMRTCYEQVEHE